MGPRAGTCSSTSATRAVTYPPDGTGLRQYPTTVTDGRLLIDLNSVERRAAEQDAENRGD